MRNIFERGKIMVNAFIMKWMNILGQTVNNLESYNSIFFDRMKETKKLDVLADEGNSDNYTNDVIQYRAPPQELSSYRILL